MNRTLTSRERIQGALWGAVLGDALGVPVEFTDRRIHQADPVTGPRGEGTWNQPTDLELLFGRFTSHCLQLQNEPVTP